MPLQTTSCSRRRLRWSWSTSLCALALALGAVSCKKNKEPTCNPEEFAEFKKVRVLIQPTDQLNLDDEGNPLSVVFRIYQLKGDTTLDIISFDKVWEEGGKVAFGDEYLDEKEFIVYPDKPDVIEIEPNPEATHFLAVAIFRDPIGQDWYRVWDVPKWHGHSVCAAQGRGEAWPDPCFYVLLDGYLVDGGHTPPSGWNKQTFAEVQCPGPPMKTPPPPPQNDKKKKKKRKKLKDLKDAKVPETPETPQAPSAPEAPTAPEAPSAPGVG